MQSGLSEPTQAARQFESRESAGLLQLHALGLQTSQSQNPCAQKSRVTQMEYKLMVAVSAYPAATPALT